MRDFRKLHVWQRAHRLTLQVHQATASFPRREQYGLTSQLRRASASIPANIAEGCGRSGDAELARFLGIAMGSANELEYHLLLARDLRYLQDDAYDRLNDEVNQLKRMLVAFTKRIRASS